jgi:hypothetical protein
MDAAGEALAMAKDRHFTPLLTRRLSLDAARNSAPMDYSGSFIAIRNADKSSTEIVVAFDRPDGQTVALRRGEGLKHHPFARLYISHSAQAGAWVELIFAGDADRANRAMFDVLLQPPAADVQLTGQDAPLQTDPARHVLVDDPDARFFRLRHDSITDGNNTISEGAVPNGKRWIVEKAWASLEGAATAGSWAGFEISKGFNILADLRAPGGSTVYGWEGLVIPAGFTLSTKFNINGTAKYGVSIWGKVESE